MTNIEKIQKMDARQLAIFLQVISTCEFNLCNECPLNGVKSCANEKRIEEWLNSPMTEMVGEGE